MKNGMAIGALARQLKSSAERIENITMDIEQFEQGNELMANTCVDLRMDELERAQMLVLKLTEMITQSSEDNQNVNQDEGGSVFAPGELTDNVGENTDGEDTDPGCSA